MQIIPTSIHPNQALNVTLSGQYCRINLYQKSGRMYVDLWADGVGILCGVICRDRDRIVRYRHLKFTGDFAFFDLQGTSDPVYTGLGDRFIFCYLDTNDLSQLWESASE